MNHSFKVGIVIDDWKLQIYKDVLNEYGFDYGYVEGPMPLTYIITVSTIEVEKLVKCCHQANTECSQSRNH